MPAKTTTKRSQRVTDERNSNDEDATLATRPLKWTEAQEQALALVFEGRWTQAEIAKKCGVSPRTIWAWIAHPDFKQRLEQLRSDFAASLRDVTYADKARRVIALDQMAEAARREFEQHPMLQEVRPTKDG